MWVEVGIGGGAERGLNYFSDHAEQLKIIFIPVINPEVGHVFHASLSKKLGCFHEKQLDLGI